MIETRNHGQLILSSTYWGSELERAGLLFVSCNAGAVRVMVPACMRELIEEARRSKYAVLSRGPWPEKGLAEAVEILFEDGSKDPYCLHLSPESFETLPAEPVGQEWVITLWDLKKGKPHKGVERICHWRRVERVPWLKPWAQPEEVIRLGREETIRKVLGPFYVAGKRYPAPLSAELAEWHCYASDGGHSILVVLPEDYREAGELVGALVPAPVKSVQRAGWQVKRGYVVCALPYSAEFGLEIDSQDEER